MNKKFPPTAEVAGVFLRSVLFLKKIGDSLSDCNCFSQVSFSEQIDLSSLHIFPIEVPNICLEEASTSEVSRERGFALFIYLCPVATATEAHPDSHPESSMKFGKYTLQTDSEPQHVLLASIRKVYVK